MKKIALVLSMILLTSSAFGISIVTSYATWQSLDETELNFNTISNGTYLTNQFINQGALFGSYSGPVYVSDIRSGSDVAGYKEIDFDAGEWIDITFVLPGTTTASYTTGFGVKFNSPDTYNWVAFYDRQGTYLATYYGNQGIAAAGNYFLGATHEAGIGRVRVGSDNHAFETYNYELIIPTVPEPATWGLLLLALGCALWAKKR